MLVSPLVHRHVFICLPLPDINPNGDVLQTESPGRVDQNIILSRTLPTLPVTFLDIGNQYLSIFRYFNDLLVFWWERGGQ